MGEGSERLGKMVLTISSFIIIFGVLVTMAGSLFDGSSSYSSPDYIPGWNFSSKTLQETEFWYNDTHTLTGYSLSSYTSVYYLGFNPDFGTQSSNPAGANQQFFPDIAESYILNTYYLQNCHIYGGDINEYNQDGLFFYESYFMDSHYQYVSVDILKLSYNLMENMGIVHLTGLKEPLYLYLAYDTTLYQKNGQGLVDAFDDKACNITVGSGAYDRDYSLATGLGAIISLLTFDGEMTGNVIFDYVMGGIIWSAIIYIAVAVIARFVP